MVVNIVHTADTHLRSTPRFDTQTPKDLFDVFSELVYFTKRQAIGGKDAALVHTGDLFDNSDPPTELVARVINLFNNYDDEMNNPPEILLIAGNHDADGTSTPALDRVVEETDAEYLTETPTVLGNNDIALYGIPAYKNGELVKGTIEFETPPENVPTALCVHGEIAANRNQYRVNHRKRITSGPELSELVPFNLTTILCGHIHKPLWHAEGTPSRFYSGAPECVRSNRKGKFGTANLLTVKNYPNDNYEAPIKRVITCARPWVEFDFEVKSDTSPQDIVDDAFERWNKIVHEKYPEIKENYLMSYSKPRPKKPTIDIRLKSEDGSGVSKTFAQDVVELFTDWGHAHAIKVEYETKDNDWVPSAVIGSGKIGPSRP